MVGQIATLLAEADINIEGMSNAARDGVAYTIVDLDDLKNEEEHKLVDRLSKIDAVYRVRVLQK